MTEWVLHYEVAAIALCIVLALLFLFDKRISTKITTAYFTLLCVTLLASAMNLVTVYTIRHAANFPLGWNYFFNVIYYLANNSIYICYSLYFILALKLKIGKVFKVCYCLPIIFNIFLISTTPWTKLLFYFDENFRYVRGSYIAVLYVIASGYMLLTIFLMLKNRFKVTTSQAQAIITYTIAILASIILQAVYPQFLLTGLATSLGLLMLYISMQAELGDSDKQMGTYNNDALAKQLESSVKRGKDFWVVTVRLGGFDTINNVYGFENANTLLRQIAEYLMEQTPWDKVFYLSGIKFACYLEKDEATVNKFVAKLEERFRVGFKFDDAGEDLDIPFSIFVANCPQHAKNAKDMIDLIRFALREPKTSDTSHVIYVNDELLKKRERHNIVEYAVNKALARNSFEVYYQPIMSTKKGRITSAEALLRLTDDEYGMIYPDEFIPVAERNGSIIQIGAFVLETVCRFIKENRIWEKGIEYIEVNLSPIECMQSNLNEKVLSIMSSYGLERKMINLEVTETAAVGGNEMVSNNMTALITEGLTFSLDDYGTGFSNTTQLIKLPFKLIKLDKSILWLAMKDESAMNVLKHTISMLHSLYREIVVEGVETKEQVDLLTELGCHYLQGYYYSKPLPSTEFLNYLACKN